MTTAIIVLGVAALLAGMGGGALVLYILGRRSRRQIGAEISSGRQVVSGSSAPTATPAFVPPARTLTPREEAEYVTDQRRKILAQLAREFPTLGEGRRAQVADEIIAKARTTLARIR